MLKGKLAVLCLAAVTLLVVNGTASAGIVDPCNSSCSVVDTDMGGSPEIYAACPLGDTDSFEDQGFYLSIIVLDANSVGIANIPPTDFWVIPCDPADLILCGGSASSTADSLTNSAGRTTMSLTSLAAGGCANGLECVVQGFIINDDVLCVGQDPCHPIEVRSVDRSGDNLVDIVDLTALSGSFGSTSASSPCPGPPFPCWDACFDYNGDLAVDIIDLTFFAGHFGPPGHGCN